MDRPSDVETVDISQPEVLSRDILITIIKQRCSAIGELDSFDKTMLLDLFHKNVAPQPQRKYRFNRRGREMTKKQISHEKLKRKHSDISCDTPTIFSTSAGTSSGNVPRSVDRLRPPPSAINSDRKIIKLGRKSNTCGPGTSASDKSDSVTHSTNTKIKVTNNRKIDVTSQTKVKNPNFTPHVHQPNGSSEVKMDTSDASESKTGTESSNSKPKIVKIMPQKPQTPASKVKLKRPSAASSYVTQLDKAECVDIVKNSSDCSHDIVNSSSCVTGAKSENHEQTVNSPEGQRKQTESKSSTESAFGQHGQAGTDIRQAESSNSESTSPTEEGMVKKFKRIAVQWP